MTEPQSIEEMLPSNFLNCSDLLEEILEDDLIHTCFPDCVAQNHQR